MSLNPLGRGLESLIPKNQQRKADDAMAPAALPPDDAILDLPMGPAEEAARVFTAPPAKIAPIWEEEAPAVQEVVRPIIKEEPAPIKEKSAPVARPVEHPKKEREPQKTAEAVYYIEVAKIHPNPDQPRKTFDEDALRELAASIREFGLLQPIVVSKIEKDTETGTEVEYELIAGERRLMATKLLGMETIPAIIRNMRLERERLELAIIENLQRENLNPLEMARAYARLQDEFRLTQREVATRLGKSRETVANTLRLLDLPSPIQESIERGQLTESHGRLLLTIDDAALQEKLFRDLLANKLTTRELKMEATNYSHAKEEQKAKAEMPAEIKMAEERLASELGAPVAIRESRGAGKITIAFYSKEELIGLLRRLGAQEDDSLFL
jgi:ParB family chromosome partitioning protein